MTDEIIPQSLNGEIGVYNAHDATDEKQQNQDLDTVIDEEVDGTAQCGGAVQSNN